MPTINTRSIKSLYSVHPGFSRESASVANLQKNTGQSLEQWIALVKGSGPIGEKERAAWLKSEHKLGTIIAAWIAERAEGKQGAADYDPDHMVKQMFAGKKEALTPIYEKLLHLGLELGEDVKACPCKTIVPLYRNHVFAEIKPATNSRIDLGLALKNTRVPTRLVDTGGFAKGDRISHRIAISAVSEIDEQVVKWLKAAYELDGK